MERLSNWVRSDGSQIVLNWTLVVVMTQTTLPVKEIVTALRKEDFNVTESYDAGRFVCNYVYYHSLCHAAAHGTRSLFVHVPLFKMIDKEQQMQFAEALLHVLAVIC